MLHITIIMLPIFCVIFLGIVSEKYKILPHETSHCINQFVYWFSLPLLRFSILAQMQIEQISWAITLGFVGGMILTQCLVGLCMRLRKYSFRDSTLGGMIAGLPNAAFMGIPTVMLLFPESEQALVIAAFISILPAVPLVTTDTALSLNNSMHAQSSGIVNITKTVAMALFCNPNLVAAVIGACIGLGGYVVPSTLLTTAQMLGNTAAPCALFCIGISLWRQIYTWNQNRIQKTLQPSNNILLQCFLIGTKLFVCPMIMCLIAYALGAQGQGLLIMCTMGAMPTAVVGSIISAKHHVLTHECILCTLLSTCFSIISIPIVIIVLQQYIVL